MIVHRDDVFAFPDLHVGKLISFFDYIKNDKKSGFPNVTITLGFLPKSVGSWVGT